MTDTPKPEADAIVTAPPVTAPSVPTEPSEDRPVPVGDPEVTTPPVLADKPRTAPAPVKI